MNQQSYQYRRDKDIIILPGKIIGPLGNRNIQLVFDPGAYRTIINTGLTDELGYQAKGQGRRISISSVAGREYGYTLVLQKLSILNFDFRNVEVASFDLLGTYGIDGLLGLDLLEHFEITLRHRERQIQFTRIHE